MLWQRLITLFRSWKESRGLRPAAGQLLLLNTPGAATDLPALERRLAGAGGGMLITGTRRNHPVAATVSGSLLLAARHGRLPRHRRGSAFARVVQALELKECLGKPVQALDPLQLLRFSLAYGLLAAPPLMLVHQAPSLDPLELLGLMERFRKLQLDLKQATVWTSPSVSQRHAGLADRVLQAEGAAEAEAGDPLHA